MRHLNKYCSACANTREQINGLYCIKLNKYVEYDIQPKCNFETDYKK